MHAIYELRDILCGELEEYGKKGELSAGTLDIVDKLAHAIKNLDKIIVVSEDTEYSNEGNFRHSYARGRRRDSMGRYASDYKTGYSRNGELADRLRDMMDEAPDERTRMEIQKLASKMEQM